MNNKLKVYSIYTGIIYDIDESSYNLLDDGQIPLLSNFKACKKCYEKGYTSFSITSYIYIPCKCVKNKFIDKVKIQQKLNLHENVQL